MHGSKCCDGNTDAAAGARRGPFSARVCGCGVGTGAVLEVWGNQAGSADQEAGAGCWAQRRRPGWAVLAEG